MEDGEIFRGVFDAVPDAVVVVDGAGRIVLANAQCREVFGCDADSLVGEPIEALVPERFRVGHPRRRAGYGAAPNPRPMGLLRLAARRADGTEFPAEISLAPIAVAGASYVSATVRDITARIRDEERFRSLLEAAPDPTVIVDDTATIVLANDQMQNVFGYAREDLVGRSITVLASTPGPEEVLERIRRYLLDPELVPMGYSQEFRLRHCTGHEVPVEIGLSPLHTDEGVLVSIAVRDMTERRRLEAESQRLRDEVIATVSHELRTPLASIIGYAELMADLDDGDLSGRARKLLGVIERNAARELQLVDDLLTMAYLDDNRLRIERVPVQLAEIARHVVDDASLRARERGLQLTVVAAEVPPVHGDFFRLVQVLENLVTNALKFTRPGGRVDVVVRDDGSRGVLEVRDTGIGVSPDEKELVFERLYRAPSAIRSQVQGAGLGLPIVRAIVDAHGGTVEVDSEVGVGTTVRVAIPHEPVAEG
ncbi:MAG TPA: PAS domain S-box protein [Nocardioides sp.]|nr:PAS domain S-box protein [Nocardioides sp.]